MVQANLFSGQEQKQRCRERICGHRGEREDETSGKIRCDINTPGFSGGTSGKNLACKCRKPKRHGFDP